MVSFQGGERRNAIPKSAKAIVASKAPLQVEDTRLSVKALEEGTYTSAIAQSNAIIKAIGAFAQGSKLNKADKKYDKYSYIDAIEIYEKVAEKGYKSVELFEKLVHEKHITIIDRQLFFINPHYEIKFRLKPKRAMCKPMR